MKKPITVTKSHLPNRQVLDHYIDRIYESNLLTNFGSLHGELQNELKSYLGIENIQLMTNGTLPIQIALRLLCSRGQSVITTPFSFVATTSSIVWEGMNPIFGDIDRASLNLNPDTVEYYLKKERNIGAILPVHVYGNCCDVEAFDYLSKKYNVPVIYDAAHAFGVKLNDQSILQYGTISTMSFHATKIFHTIEGGALISPQKDFFDRAKLMINFGITGPDKVSTLGINGKMNEFQAAMGLAYLKELDTVFLARKRTFDHYMKNISPSLPAIKRPRGSRNYSYFPVLFPNEAMVLATQISLKKIGADSRRYFYPCLSNLEFVEKKQTTPIADDIVSRILCLPMFAGLSEERIEEICAICNEILAAQPTQMNCSPE